MHTIMMFFGLLLPLVPFSDAWISLLKDCIINIQYVSVFHTYMSAYMLTVLSRNQLFLNPSGLSNLNLVTPKPGLFCFGNMTTLKPNTGFENVEIALRCRIKVVKANSKSGNDGNFGSDNLNQDSRVWGTYRRKGEGWNQCVCVSFFSGFLNNILIPIGHSAITRQI